MVDLRHLVYDSKEIYVCCLFEKFFEVSMIIEKIFDLRATVPSLQVWIP
jgi:hypothetical protein